MSRQDANAAFALTSFLYGTNAAYIDDLYARYEKDPDSVDAEWQEFFKSLKDAAGRRPQERRGPVLGPRQLAAAAARRSDLGARRQLGRSRKGGRRQGRGQGAGQARKVELTAADVQQATRDSMRALMLIRAYRMRGHFHANLDPLGIEPPRDREELDPRSYGFTEADFDRKIFLDHVLGLEFGTLREIVAILRAHLLPDARRRVHAHLQRRAEGLDPGAHRGPGQGNQLHPRGQARDPQRSWSRPKASRNSATSNSPAPSASASTAANR